ncbi:MAG TPA: hypothetical protein VK079_00095 [Bacillota bacterium]|nr:hypothetical protein [Bacillota bacterium]
MRKVFFYLFIIAQIVILLVLVGQYYLIESYGKSFKIYLNETYDYSTFNNHQDIYVEYEITEIAKEHWSINEKLSYNDRVYVMLEENTAGVFEVIDVAEHKLVTSSDQQVVLKANYVYDHAGMFKVDYRLNNEININQFVDVARDEKVVAHFKLAPWGQIKLITLENTE